MVATELFPSATAVMTLLPTASAVTRPEALTVATVALLVVNVTGRPSSEFPCASSGCALSYTV